jgi:hypothetical protein
MGEFMSSGLTQTLDPPLAPSFAQSAIWAEAQELLHQSGDPDEIEALADQAIEFAGEHFPGAIAESRQLITDLKNRLIAQLEAL